MSTLHHKNEVYEVMLDPAGDHIVNKHSKKDPLHAYAVDRDSRTWAEVINILSDIRNAMEDAA